jgi:hypothetical protein
MGGGSSKSTSNIDIVNNSIIESIVSASQNISGTLNANQQINHSGLGILTGATQNVTLNISGMQKVIVDQDLISDMAQRIIQNVQSNNGKLFGGSANSSVSQKLQNYLRTKISTNFVQNCVAAAVANQLITYSGVQIATLDRQNIDYFQKCMSDSLNKGNVAQGITSDSDQAANSNNTGISFGFSLGNYIYYILAFIIIIVIAYYSIQYKNTQPINKNE